METNVSFMTEFNEYIRCCKAKDFAGLINLGFISPIYFSRCQRFVIEHGEAGDWMLFVQTFKDDPRIDKKLVTDQLLAWRGEDYQAMCNAYLWLSDIIDMERWNDHCTIRKDKWCN